MEDLLDAQLVRRQGDCRSALRDEVAHEARAARRQGPTECPMPDVEEQLDEEGCSLQKPLLLDCEPALNLDISLWAGFVESDPVMGPVA